MKSQLNDEKKNINEEYDFKSMIPKICLSYGDKANKKFKEYEYINYDNINNFIKYKQAHSNNYKKEYDCDSIFSNLFNNEIVSLFGCNASDTMNSLQTYANMATGETGNKALQCVLDKKFIYDDNIDGLYNAFNDFAKYTHSIGNFICIPDGINRPYEPTHDFLDTYLIIIEEYIETRNKRVLKKIFVEEQVNKACEWLDSYTGFSSFLEKNFLELLVKYNHPITWRSNKDICNTLELLNAFIIYRGKQMTRFFNADNKDINV